MPEALELEVELEYPLELMGVYLPMESRDTLWEESALPLSWGTPLLQPLLLRSPLSRPLPPRLSLTLPMPLVAQELWELESSTQALSELTKGSLEPTPAFLVPLVPTATPTVDMG